MISQGEKKEKKKYLKSLLLIQFNNTTTAVTVTNESKNHLDSITDAHFVHCLNFPHTVTVNSY